MPVSIRDYIVKQQSEHEQFRIEDAPQFIEELCTTIIATPAGIADPRLMRDEVNPRFASSMAEILPLTAGARELLASAGTIGRLLKVMLADKAFRATLRAFGDELDERPNADLAIRAMEILQIQKPDPAPPVIASAPLSLLPPMANLRPGPAVTRGSSIAMPAAPEPLLRAPPALPVSPPPAQPISPPQTVHRPAPHEVLSSAAFRPQAAVPANVRDLKFSTASASGVVDVTVDQLINALQNGTDFATISRWLASFVECDHKMQLLVLHRAYTRGTWRVHPSTKAAFLTVIVRLLGRSNAHRKAFDLASAMLADTEMMSSLPPDERLRIRMLVARAALRCGKRRDAQAMFKKLFFEFPNRTDIIMNNVAALFVEEPKWAAGLCNALLKRREELNRNDLAFIGDVLLQNGRQEDAILAFWMSLDGPAGNADGLLGFANCALANSDAGTWTAAFGEYGNRTGLTITDIAPGVEDDWPWKITTEHGKGSVDGPLVTVVMTSFNAEATLRFAMNSVLAQTYANLELIVVDDFSIDLSRNFIFEVAETDPRISYIFTEQNRGTYVAKNAGIAIAKGDFITFHDSDDWMHPNRLAECVRALEPSAACITSEWVRMNEAMRLMGRRDGFTHINPASTFIRRAAFDEIGLFDSVRVGADAEILSRLRARYGLAGVKHLRRTLGIGLHHSASLTQSGETAFDEYRFSAVRQDYTEAWLDWHIEQLAANVPVVIRDGARPFAVPEAIAVT